MNWKRGLIRLWLVVAVLWFVAAAGVYAALFSKQETVAPESQDAPASGYRSKPYKPYTDEPDVAEWWFLAVVAVVPLALFGIGATGYWVVRGFKPPNSN